MMTTMAALMGTLPIALGFGAGAEARRPLGLAVVGGLLSRSSSRSTSRRCSTPTWRRSGGGWGRRASASMPPASERVAPVS